MPSWSDDEGRCHFSVNGVPCYRSPVGCPMHAIKEPRRKRHKVFSLCAVGDGGKAVSDLCKRCGAPWSPGLCGVCDREVLLRERDEARAEVDRWKDLAWRAAVAQDEARAEVERLKGSLTEQGILLSRLGIEKPELDALVQASWRTVAARQREACARAMRPEKDPTALLRYEAAEICWNTPLVTEGDK